MRQMRCAEISPERPGPKTSWPNYVLDVCPQLILRIRHFTVFTWPPVAFPPHTILPEHCLPDMYVCLLNAFKQHSQRMCDHVLYRPLNATRRRLCPRVWNYLNTLAVLCAPIVLPLSHTHTQTVWDRQCEHIGYLPALHPHGSDALTVFTCIVIPLRASLCRSSSLYV